MENQPSGKDDGESDDYESDPLLPHCAAGQGLEPQFSRPERDVLPLDDPAMPRHLTKKKHPPQYVHEGILSRGVHMGEILLDEQSLNCHSCPLEDLSRPAAGCRKF